MGISLGRDTFLPGDYREFSVRLDDQLRELRERVGEPSFNREYFSLGAELEVYLVDGANRPACANEQLLQLVNHHALTPEINRYNLELNFTPVHGKGSFSELQKEMYCLLDMLADHAQGIGVGIVPIGILPTLQREHLKSEYMTDDNRYRALEKSLRGSGHKRYKININGLDPLVLEGEGISVEGANTSFQVHLRVPADRFADYFNAAQLTTPLLLGMCTNSPLVVGHRLWQESRIALFKQSVDFREHEELHWRQPSRVSFGHGWVRREAWELFSQNVALYEPLLPILYDNKEPFAFSELCLHHGTVWPWNRAVYHPGREGHLRIEFRALPAGPTVLDMVANAVLAVGMALGLADEIDFYSARLPFAYAEYNFYRAAQHGLKAPLIWPHKGRGGFGERPIVEIIEEFLPIARKGIDVLGMESDEIDKFWSIIEERFEKQVTGAVWQLDRFELYRKSCSVDESCLRLLEDYRNNIATGKQVAVWD